MAELDIEQMADNTTLLDLPQYNKRTDQSKWKHEYNRAPDGSIIVKEKVFKEFKNMGLIDEIKNKKAVENMENRQMIKDIINQSNPPTLIGMGKLEIEPAFGPFGMYPIKTPKYLK